MKMMCVIRRPREYGEEKKKDRGRRREGKWKQEKAVGRAEETSKSDNIGGCKK
jgi:hypothetical protein